jgi:hypothetical protein
MPPLVYTIPLVIGLQSVGGSPVTLGQKTSANSIPVVLPSDQTITITGSSIVAQGAPNTVANAWPVYLSDQTSLLGTATHPVRVDPTSTTTQPISGTVTANAGTNLNTSALATSANQTNSSQKTQVVDGSGNIIGSTNNSLYVGLIGGGAAAGILVKDDTVYGDGVTSGVLSATHRLWNGTNYDRAYGDKTNGAWVNIKSSVAVAVTGTFWQATQPVSGTFWQATQPISGNVGTVSAAINVNQTTSNSTAVQFQAGSIASTNGILVQALSANTASVFIGNSGVTTSNGFELQAGQAVPFTASNVNLLYVIGSNNTDKVCWSVL